jgi:hypothetical protein
MPKSSNKKPVYQELFDGRERKRAHRKLGVCSNGRQRPTDCLGNGRQAQPPNINPYDNGRRY